MKRIREFFGGIFRVYCREFRLVLRDPGIILFLTFLPLAYPVIYSLIHHPGPGKEGRMRVVHDTRPPLSRQPVREIDACAQARVMGNAADLPKARRTMDSHKCFAILEIPGGFGRKIGRSESASAAMYCDMSLLLRYRGFLVAATEVMQSMGGELLTEKIDLVAPLAETVVTEDLLPIENISMGNIRNGFDSFIMPGVLILILHQCIVLALGMAGGARREKASAIGYNPHNNARYIPATMIGQMLCYSTLLALPALYMIHYVPLMFRFPMEGNLLEEMAFLMPMLAACFGIGFVLQAFTTERESVFVSWVVTSLIFLLLSGLIWPRYDMYGVWKAMSDICPATWAVEGFVKMNSNGAALWQVRHEYLMLWLNAAGWLTAGYCAQRWCVLPAIYGKSRKSVDKEVLPTRS